MCEDFGNGECAGICSFFVYLENETQIAECFIFSLHYRLNTKCVQNFKLACLLEVPQNFDDRGMSE